MKGYVPLTAGADSLGAPKVKALPAFSAGAAAEIKAGQMTERIVSASSGGAAQARKFNFFIPTAVREPRPSAEHICFFLCTRMKILPDERAAYH